jgi:iron complex outermembrane receptor protein
VIRRDVLRAAPHTRGSDLMRTVPGVAITQHSGQGKAHQIFFRGFDAEHGQDVEVFVGGAPVNEVSNIHGQGYADLNFVMPEVVKELRSTPGTYDPRQGEFAVAGSLAFDLGIDEPGIQLLTTLGSFGEKRLFASWHPADAPDETFAAAEVQQTDGFGPNRAAERTSAIAQALFATSRTSTMRVMASVYGAHFDSAGAIPLTMARTESDDRFVVLDPKQGGDATRLQLVFDFQGEGVESGDRWTVAPFLVRRSLRLRQNFTGFLVDPIGGDGTEQINDSTTFGTNTSYEKKLKIFSDKDRLSAGIYARGDVIDQSQKRLSGVNDAPTATLVDASLSVVDVAGWSELSVRPIDRLTLRAGLRVDGIHGQAQDRAIVNNISGEAAASDGPRRGAFGVNVGKKASAEVVALPGLKPFVSYGEGFRGRQVRSLSNGEDAPVVSVQSGEVGVRGALDRISGTLTGFYTYLDNDLVFDPELARNEPQGPTSRTGLAADLTIRPTDWMVHASSVTYVHAVFAETDADHDEGDLVPYAPQMVGRSDLAAVPVIARVLERDLSLRFGMGLTFLGVRPLPFSELGTNQFFADASVGARLGEVELRVDATNVLDAAYFDGEFVYASQFEQGAAASLVPQRHVTIGPPRAIFGTLALHL